MKTLKTAQPKHFIIKKDGKKYVETFIRQEIPVIYQKSIGTFILTVCYDAGSLWLRISKPPKKEGHLGVGYSISIPVADMRRTLNSISEKAPAITPEVKK
jgi:hypothetical protein